MIVTLCDAAGLEDRERVELELRDTEMEFTEVAGAAMNAYVVQHTAPPEIVDALQALPGVERVFGNGAESGLVSREYRSEGTVVHVGAGAAHPAAFSADQFVVVGGPCAVEDPEQMADVSSGVAERGAAVLRGGAYKPRTSPYSFQGLGVPGLEMLAEQRERLGRPVVTEVIEPGDVGLVSEYADMLQIGARNMQNYSLLSEAGRSGMPVLLKRGLSATVAEWLSAAEYVLVEGNEQVVLCERGIRTYEPATRFTLDISAVPVAQELTHLPVIVDPSHASGRAGLVAPLAMAAAAAGASGVMLDVHTQASRALCDGAQALDMDQFSALVGDLDRVLSGLGRRRVVTEPVAAGVT